MTAPPRVERRDAVPYVAIVRRGAGVEAFRAAVDSAFPQLFGWLADQSAEAAGPPFIRYLAFDPEGPFAIEVGAPVAPGMPADGEVRAGALPAGRYVAYLHVGAYRATTPQWRGRDLAAAHETVLSWAQRHAITWDVRETAEGTVWGARVERYLVGPPAEPDPARWQTELLFLTADGTAPAPPPATAPPR